MKNIVRQLGCAVLIPGSASISFSQVKRVEMHIAGYLCGKSYSTNIETEVCR